MSVIVSFFKHQNIKFYDALQSLFMPLLLIFVFVRPFIGSLTAVKINFAYSALLFLFLFCWILFKKNPIKKDAVSWLLPLFFGSILVSWFINKDSIAVNLHLFQYINGILLFLTARALTHKHKTGMILTLLASGVCASLLAIHQYFFGFQNVANYLSEHNIIDPVARNCILSRRVFAPFCTSNALGGFLAMLLPLAFSLKNRKWIALPLFLALLLTQSVGASLALLAVLIIYLWQIRSTARTGLLLAAFLLIGASVIFITRNVTPMPWFHPSFSIKMRLIYWEETLRLIQSHFWLGTGLGSFDLPSARYAHNSYLQLWAENGLLGITAFLALLIALFKSGMANITARAETRFLLMGCGVFLLHNLIDFTFFLPETSLIWCVMFGLALNTSAPETGHAPAVVKKSFE